MKPNPAATEVKYPLQEVTKNGYEHFADVWLKVIPVE
jgi:hypothetical protein